MHSSVRTLLVASIFVFAACGDDDNHSTPAADTQTGSTGNADTSSSTTAAATTTTSAASSTTESADDTGSGSGSGSGGVDIDALYDCAEPNLVVAAEFSGPGYDPEEGLIGDPQDTYVAFTTQIMAIPEAQAQFDMLVGGVLTQLQSTEGLIGVSLAIEPTCGFARTLGVFESEQAMYAFVGSGAHAEAMSMTSQVALTGRTTSWELGADDIPMSWETAVAELADMEPLVF